MFDGSCEGFPEVFFLLLDAAPASSLRTERGDRGGALEIELSIPPNAT